MRVPQRLARARLVQRLRLHLQSQSHPHLELALIVAIAAMVGFVTSVVLRWAGVDSMAVRYPLALIAAYGVFVALIGLWLKTRDDDWQSDALDAAVDLAGDGGNARGSDVGDVIGAAAEADELGLILLVLAALLALGAVIVSLVYQAPVLLAEVALDGALAGSLYHRLRPEERRHWLDSVWLHTRWQFAVLFGLLALLGWGLQWWSPQATTLGQALGLS